MFLKYAMGKLTLRPSSLNDTDDIQSLQNKLTLLAKLHADKLLISYVKVLGVIRSQFLKVKKGKIGDNLLFFFFLCVCIYWCYSFITLRSIAESQSH